MSKGQTLFDMFLKVTTLYKNEVVFVYKKDTQIISITYEHLFNDVLLLSKHFSQHQVKKGDKVMFVSDNRYEWIVSDLALLSLGAISVPRACDTPSDELEYIITHSESSFLIIEHERAKKSHEQILAQLSLKKIFVMDQFEDILNNKESISQDDINNFIQLHTLHENEDMFSIIYTSGTTGRPKGVMLNHKNMMYNIEKVPKLIELDKSDMWLSILPPWHIFERGVEYVSLSSGSTMVYSSPKTFAADLEEFKPTLVATVPRVWESMYAKINNTLNKTPNKAYIFNLLVNISKGYKYNQRVLQDKLPRYTKENFLQTLARKAFPSIKLVLLAPFYFVAQKRFLTVQEKFGGRLRYAISGGGSLPEYVDEWIDALGINIINSYGMTECSPSIAGRAKGCDVFGSVGAPLEGTDLIIVDEKAQQVPPGVVGDILVKGPQVMSGYYNNEVENIKTFTADGYLRTGDLGKLTVTGELVLTGRSKEIIVLANGENVDPSRIEAAISIFPYVSDSMLVGQDKKGLGLLIVADFELLKDYIHKKLDVVIESVEHLMQNQHLLSDIKSELNEKLHKSNGFKSFEKLQNIHFLESEFKVGEELTNTFKKKRHIIEQKYKELIDSFLK